MTTLTYIEGDLLDTDVEVIVNSWNRNQWWTPDWLARPSGVSGQIKQRGGADAIRELRKTGAMQLGEARWTGAGALPYRGIIHVAGIDNRWRATANSVQLATANALTLAASKDVKSIALPVIGAGHGKLAAREAEHYMQLALNRLDNLPLAVTIVRYRPQT